MTEHFWGRKKGFKLSEEVKKKIGAGVRATYLRKKKMYEKEIKKRKEKEL